LNASSTRSQALVERLGLLVVVVTVTGLLVGLLFVPPAVLASDAVDFVAGDLLDVGPLPEAELPPENSFIYAADDSLLAEINFEENRETVRLRDVPQVAVDAVISTEDATFYEHHGINVQAIISAAIANMQAGEVERGGSTITQQYVKNAFLSDRATEQSIDRKIVEAVWAVELEKRLSKDEILERYLNRTYFGSGAYGIGTAAERYFSKPASDLTLPEAAMLAGLIRSPERNSPLVSEKNALDRRNIVLDQMVINGFITRDQRDAAKQTPLGLQPSEPPPPEQPFWTDWVAQLLWNEDTATALGTQTEALELMGETREERIQSVFQGGLRVYTTMRPDFQAVAEQAIQDALTADEETREQLAQEPMGGIVSIEPGTGAIRTMALGPYSYGSCREDGDWAGVAENGEMLCDKSKVNPLVYGAGTEVGRQPGSSFKPYVIAAALESGLPPGWTTDARSGQVIEGCADNYAPNNAGGDGFHDMYSGVKNSVNVFHAKLVAEIGVAPVKDMAERLGLREWSNRTPLTNLGCSIGLGATDVVALEMAAAYATLANRGVYCEPFAIERIENREGDVLYEHTPRCEQVVDTDVVDRVVDIMHGPVTPGGTAGFMQAAMGNYPVRGKTGTTDDSRDAWFVGYVKQLATAAWIGYPNGTRYFETDEQAVAACPGQHESGGVTGNICLPENPKLMQNVTIGGQGYARVYGGTIPAPMWAAYMTQLLGNWEPEGFPEPGPLPTVTVPDVMRAATVAEAEAIAEGAGLTLVTVTEVDYRPAGTPIRQEPAAGTRIQAGKAIVLYLSDGTGQVPTVPNVVGMTRADAEQTLTAAGYNVRVFTKPTNNADEVGLVLAQSPSGGEAVDPSDGATVSIQVGVERRPGGGGGGTDGDSTNPPPDD
jgi:membrane peptidoglycan carboxypeptidase